MGRRVDRFFDLDEYLHFEDGTTFRTLTSESPDRDGYLFESRWAEDRGDTNPRGAGIKDAFVEVYANPVTEGPDDRTKYLARTSSVVLPGIHHPTNWPQTPRRCTCRPIAPASCTSTTSPTTGAVHSLTGATIGAGSRSRPRIGYVACPGLRHPARRSRAATNRNGRKA